MIADIAINLLFVILIGSLFVSIFLLYRNNIIYKIRMKALDIVSKRLNILINARQCLPEDITIAYSIFDHPTYTEMLHNHLEKWKFEDFYPDLVEDETITLQVGLKEISE